MAIQLCKKVGFVTNHLSGCVRDVLNIVMWHSTLLVQYDSYKRVGMVPP